MGVWVQEVWKKSTLFFEGFPKGNSELKTVCKVSTVFNILSQKLYISIMSLTNTAIKFCY